MPRRQRRFAKRHPRVLQNPDQPSPLPDFHPVHADGGQDPVFFSHRTEGNINDLGSRFAKLQARTPFQDVNRLVVIRFIQLVPCIPQSPYCFLFSLVYNVASYRLL